MENRRDHTISVIGAGRLGRALSSAVIEAGYSVLAVANRSLDRGRVLAESLGVGNVIPLESVDLIPGDILLVTVSDDAISAVDAILAGRSCDWADRVILHTSGAHSSDRLKQLRAAGAAVGSFHPLQTFSENTPGDHFARLFSDIPIAVEGDDRAVDVGMEIARSIKAAPFRISTASKTLYHAAAVTASNYLVTLLALAEEMNELADPDAESPPEIFRALAVQAVSNMFELGPEEALTGPVVRGDVDLIERHLSALLERAPHLVAVYAAMAKETVRLANTSGRLGAESAERILDVLARYKTP